MEPNETTLLPPQRPLRWRPEYVNLLRRQYVALDQWADETGLPIGALIRQAVDEALRRRGFDGPPSIVEVPK
jgi:hypothetical protein